MDSDTQDDNILDKVKDAGKSIMGDKDSLNRMAKRDEASMKKDFPGFYGRYDEHR